MQEQIKKNVAQTDVQKKMVQQVRQEPQEESCEIRKIEETEASEVSLVSGSDASLEQVSTEAGQTKESTKQDSTQTSRDAKANCAQKNDFFEIVVFFIIVAFLASMCALWRWGMNGVVALVVIAWAFPYLLSGALKVILPFSKELEEKYGLWR